MVDSSLPPHGARRARIDPLGEDLALWERPGNAMPIVLVHGNGASKEAFRPLFESQSLAGHRLIAFDFPGSGDSADAAAPETTYTLPQLGKLLAATIRILGLNNYVLVGWSLGGHIAIESLLHGNTPAGVVLTGTPPCGPDPAEIAATFLPVPGSEFTAAEHVSPDVLAQFLKIAYAPSEPTEPLCQDAERADGRMRKRLFEHIFATPELEPQRLTIRNWPGPFALIQGPLEPFFRPRDLDGLQWRHLWRGGTQWIDGAGHAPFYSHPDAYGRILKAFAEDLAANT